ncbi:MAG: hypothetical protein M1820_006738 [Bogoriella megaspora]|nr:MAG: hypothetical protein M1820_006738 [Bogoriella megaspora]
MALESTTQSSPDIQTTPSCQILLEAEEMTKPPSSIQAIAGTHSVSSRSNWDTNPAVTEQAANAISYIREKFLSRRKRINAKRRNVRFPRVLGSVFHRTDNNLSRPLINGTRSTTGALFGPSLELSPDFSLDIISPPAFTFSSPVLQASSTNASGSSNGQVVASTKFRTRENSARWSLITGGSSAFEHASDGSNDRSRSRMSTGGLVGEPPLEVPIFGASKLVPAMKRNCKSMSPSRARKPIVKNGGQRSKFWKHQDHTFDHGNQGNSSLSATAGLEQGADGTNSGKAPYHSDYHAESAGQSPPYELLHQIFDYLHPMEFNAARHVCRHWMSASLDVKLLRTMLVRAGWSRNARSMNAEGNDLSGIISQAWALSCTLARVCALTSGWTGAGVKICQKLSTASDNTTALRQGGTVDFRELAGRNHPTKSTHESGLLFTVSVCGRFLMVASGTDIFVYRIGQRSHLELTVRIICPQKVIGMSMDTTCGRFAVAAILAGRAGMVCDLISDMSSVPPTPSCHENAVSRHSTHTRLSHQSGDSEESGGSSVPSSESGPLALIIAEDSSPRRRSMSIAANRIPSFTKRLRNHCHSASEVLPCSYMEASQPPTLYPSKRTIYRDLCYPHDPPRAVAICPSRNCVAFGCNAGTQLHWTDIVTKETEDRFFPLSATTDVLYFIPPRNVDPLSVCCSTLPELPNGSDTRRLRLIGSAVAPKPGNYRDSRRPKPKFDHYRAVPLSDGQHMLFTDPPTGLLCLGCDSPSGHMKLLRKLILVPPFPQTSDSNPSPDVKIANVRTRSERRSESTETWGHRIPASTDPLDDESQILVYPTVYTAGSNTTNGVFIVAAYDEALVLYTIPPDIFALCQHEHQPPIPASKSKSPQDSSSETPSSPPSHPQPNALAWLPWYPDPPSWATCSSLPTAQPQTPSLSYPNTPPPSSPPQPSIWPLKVRGSYLGRAPSVVDIAVCNEHGDLTVWVLSADGRAVVWEIDSGVEGECKKRGGVDSEGCVRWEEEGVWRGYDGERWEDGDGGRERGGKRRRLDGRRWTDDSGREWKTVERDWTPDLAHSSASLRLREPSAPWATDLGDVPYELLMGNEDPADTRRFPGWWSGMVSVASRPAPGFQAESEANLAWEEASWMEEGRAGSTRNDEDEEDGEWGAYEMGGEGSDVYHEANNDWKGDLEEQSTDIPGEW